ncbi:MAG: SRPBCC family protein [Actinobacteria bacterium]|nr:SRPBCC family protein [Actinomycetota bacterium]
MARYVTTIQSTLPVAEAFAYMAEFSNAQHWDPSVETATRTTTEPVETGAGFDLVVRFAGRKVPMHYSVVSYAEPRLVVLEALQPTFVSRDTITVAPDGEGSSVHYDALLEFKGAAGRVLDPLLQLIFNRTGDKAAGGMRTALNP